MSLYNSDGNVRVTEADGNSRGLYAPDGSWFVNIDSGNKGLYGPNGCLNVMTWDGTYNVYNPDGGFYTINGVLVTASFLNERNISPTGYNAILYKDDSDTYKFLLYKNSSGFYLTLSYKVQ